MNDNTDTPAEKANQEQPNIAINAQYIKDVSFENPHSPVALSYIKTAPKIDVVIDIKANSMNETLYEVVLSLKATATAEDKTIYLAELAYAALVTVLNIDGQNLERALLIYVPSLLFPFARGILCNLTRDAGLPPLMLDPVDFTSLYNSKKKSA